MPGYYKMMYQSSILSRCILVTREDIITRDASSVWNVTLGRNELPFEADTTLVIKVTDPIQ